MNWIERDRAVIWHPYTQMKTADPPLPIVRGEGAWLETASGERYLDAVASWWTNLHGHGHPHLAAKVAAQAHTLEHVIFAGFTHPPAITLAERLLPLLPTNQARVFFSDNGSTAVEVALKMAIQYFYNQGQSRRTIVAFADGFHGETFGAMAASGELDLNNPFRPFLFPVQRIPTPVPGQEAASLAALESILATEEVAAFVFEPLVCGAGGMLMYEPAILDALMARCRAAGVLCIADEVMTGFGRTGRLFASLYLEQQPDLMALSKGLTGGMLPMALTTCSEAVFAAFYADDKQKTLFHGHSFTGNPLGCAAAHASLDLLLDPDCQARIQELMRRHADFVATRQGHPALKDLRQCGTILALEFQGDGPSGYFNHLRDQLYQFFLDRKILLRPLGNVVYVLPPYCITAAELDQVYQALDEALTVFAPALKAVE